MSKDDIDLAIIRIDGAIANKGRISCIVAEGQGQSNRDVPVTLSAEDSVEVFLALRDVLLHSGLASRDKFNTPPIPE
jgi:hypothetical protein